MKIWPDKVVRWCRDGDFLRPVFVARRMQRISDLHSKFALRPHNVWKYGTSNVRPLRLGEERKKTRMWANAQRDGRPAEHRWRPLFNVAKLADAHY